MSIKSTYLLFLIYLGFSFGASSVLIAQSEKNEIEKSIKKHEMPILALEFIDTYFDDPERIKYYQEKDGDVQTFEAKLEWHDHKYSVEFKGNGEILDIEQLIVIDEISETLRTAINEEIANHYNSYEITRLQRQFLPKPDSEDDIRFFLDNDYTNLSLRYELEIDARNKKELGSFELLFSDQGVLIQKRRIVRRSFDNIWIP